MATGILHDAEQGIAVLIDREVGRALGPVVEGEGAVEALEAFIAGLPHDAAKLLPHELDRVFAEFIGVLNAPEEAEEAEPEAPVAEASAAGDQSNGSGLTPPAAPSADEAAPTSEASASVTGQTVPCVPCSGTGKVGGNPAGEACASCGGTGVVPMAA